MSNFYGEYPPSSGGGGSSGVASLNGLTGALTLIGGTGISITPSGTNITIASTSSATVSSVSVVSANGFAGSVATATTTPAITLTTTISGLLQGNGTAISAATTGNLTDAGTDGIIVTSGTGAVLGSGTSIAQHVADASHNGYLSSTDWTTFNNKQPSGSYPTGSGTSGQLAAWNGTSTLTGYTGATTDSSGNIVGRTHSSAALTGGVATIYASSGSGSTDALAGLGVDDGTFISANQPYLLLRHKADTSNPGIIEYSDNPYVFYFNVGTHQLLTLKYADVATFTNTVEAAGVGSVSAPSFALADHNTGLYYISSGISGYTQSGTKTYQVDSTGITMAGSFGVTTPALKMSGFSTAGVLLNNSSGVVSSSAGALAVANGGTAVTSAGTSGNLLTSNGSTWTSAAPATVSLTAGVSGILPVANGGTGVNALTFGTYTPALTGFGTVSAASGVYFTIGKFLYVQASWTNGTVAGSMASISLPNSNTIDNTKVTITNTTGNPGPFVGNYAGVGTGFSGPLVLAVTTSTSLVYFGPVQGSTNNLTPNNGNQVGGNSGIMSVNFIIPIS